MARGIRREQASSPHRTDRAGRCRTVGNARNLTCSRHVAPADAACAGEPQLMYSSSMPARLSFPPQRRMAGPIMPHGAYLMPMRMLPCMCVHAATHLHRSNAGCMCMCMVYVACACACTCACAWHLTLHRSNTGCVPISCVWRSSTGCVLGLAAASDATASCGYALVEGTWLLLKKAYYRRCWPYAGRSEDLLRLITSWGHAYTGRKHVHLQCNLKVRPDCQVGVSAGGVTLVG